MGDGSTFAVVNSWSFFSDVTVGNERWREDAEIGYTGSAGRIAALGRVLRTRS
jgi:hypothetical protein